MPKVMIPGVGNVSFPDDMSEAEITGAIERDILPNIPAQSSTSPTPTPAPKPATVAQPEPTLEPGDEFQMQRDAAAATPSGSRIPGSVMDGFTTAPSKPLIDVRGAPVRAETAASIKAASDAATPEQRAVLQGRTDYVGSVARKVAEQDAVTEATQVGSELSGKAENRAARLMKKDKVSPEIAGGIARSAALAGVTPGEETSGSLQASTFDFDTKAAFKNQNAAVRGAAKGAIGLGQGVVGMTRLFSDVLGTDALGAAAKRTGDSLDSTQAAIGEQGPYAQKMFEGAVASITQQLPMLIGGAVTGSEALVLGGMFVQSLGQEYDNGLRFGQTPQQAFARASSFAAFEVVGEKFGLGHLMKGLRGAVDGMDAKTLSHHMSAALLAEIPGEELTTLGQFLTDKLGYNVGQNVEAGLADYLQQAGDTLAQTALQGGMMFGGAHAVRAARRPKETLDRFFNPPQPQNTTVATDLLKGTTVQTAAPAAAPVATEAVAPEAAAPAPVAAPAAPEVGTTVPEAGTIPEADDAALNAQFDAQAGPMAKDEGAATSVPPVEIPSAGPPVEGAETASELPTPQPEAQNAPAAPESSDTGIRSEQIGVPSVADTAFFTATKADGTLSIPETEEETSVLGGLNARLSRLEQPLLPAGAARIEEATDAEAAVSDALKRALGVQVQWVTVAGKAGVDGFVQNRGGGNRTVYIVRPQGNEQKSDALFIAGHELTHVLRQEHPDLYAELHGSLQRFVSQKAKGAAAAVHQVADTDRGNGLGSKLDEEINADFAGNLFADPSFLESLSQENPTAFGEFIQIAKEFLDKMLAAVQRVAPPNSQFVKDTKAARDVVHHAFTQWAAREQQSPAVNEQQQSSTTEDRRTDVARRKAIEEMSPEEMKRELLTDDLTGLGNRRAYDEAKKLPVTVSIDADSLKWINDNMGHESGDQLLKVIGGALQGMDAYHISGDEFIAQFESKGVAAVAMKRVEQALKKAVLTVKTPDGETITIKGVGATHGIGKDKATADAELAKRKQEREQTGERAARGEQPARVVRESERAADRQAEKAPEGKQARKRVDAKPADKQGPVPVAEEVARAKAFEDAFNRVGELQLNPELKKSQVRAFANKVFAAKLIRAEDHAETLRLLQDMDAEDALDELQTTLLFNAEQAGISASPSRADASDEYEAVAKDALAGMKTPRGSSVAIMSGRETPDIPATGRHSRTTVFDLASYFQEKNGAFFPQGLDSEAARDEVAQTLAHEAMFALSQDGHAVGWYDREVKRALKIAARVHPEILTDPEHRFAFSLATAITSNGQDVFSNFRLGRIAYEQWKKDGRFAEELQGGGPRGPQMAAAFATINKLVDEHGWQSVEAFFLDKMPAREVFAETGLKVDGENMDSIVPGAAAFGPKIGNFYYNLNGQFDTVTMDLWWMRTINRVTGRLLRTEPESFGKHLDSLERHLDAGVNTFGFNPDRIRAEIAKWRSWGEARQSNSALIKKNLPNLYGYAYTAFREYAKPVMVDGKKKTFVNRTPQNYNAKAILEGVTGMADSPRNGSEREWMRDVAQRAMAFMRERGLTLTAADFQAVLWYYEKDLYTKLGAANEKAKPASYTDAAREVFGDDSVEGDAGSAGQVRRGVGQAPAGSDRQGALQLDQEAGAVDASPSRGVNIEVAPNPDNVDIADRFNALTEAQKQAATYEVADAIIPEVLRDMGIEGATVEHTIGGFEGGSNPSLILHFPNDVSFDTMVEAGKALGTVFEQKAIIAYDETDSEGSQGGFFFVEPSRPLTYNEQAALFGRIFKVMPEAAGFTGRDGKMVFGNFTELPDADFHNKLDAAVLTLGRDVEFKTSYGKFRSEWVEPVTLEGTRYGESNTGAVEAGNTGPGRIDSLRSQTQAILAKHTEAGQAGGEEVTAAPERSVAVGGPAFFDRNEEEEDVDEMTHAQKLARRHPKFRVNSPEFKKWFAGSKIVNQDGSPQVWYHGTAQDIRVFKPKQAKAIFLTQSPNFAEDFAHASVEWMQQNAVGNKGAPSLYPLYVRAEKPFDYKNSDDITAVLDFAREDIMRDIDTKSRMVSRAPASPGVVDLQWRRRVKELQSGDWAAVEDPIIQRAIHALGYDSFYVIEAGTRNLAVFSPNQVKSASGNSGAFSTEDDDISARTAADWAVLSAQARTMYQSGTKIAQIASQLKIAPKTVMKLIGSVFTPAGGNHFVVEDETRAQAAERKVLDRFNRLQVIQNAIEEQGGTLDDVNNVYRALERMPGRTEARVNDFVDHELKPFIEAAADAGIDLKHIAEYAILKHAKERNAQIAKINPNFPDGGSGITNDEVDAMQADQQQRSDYAQLKALGDRFLNLTHGTRDILQQGGLLSAGERKAWEDAYKNYVPLRGGDIDDMAGEIDMSGNTGGFLDQRGALSKRAMGRLSVPDPARVFADVINDRYGAIVRDEKNRIGKTMMKLVLDNPDPDLWGIDERKKSRVIEKDAAGNETVVERFTDNRDPKNTLVTKSGGREFVITIKDDTLAAALLNLNDDDIGFVMRTAGRANRMLTKMWTQWNPVFTLRNFIRDLGTGMIHTAADKGLRRAATVAKHIPNAVFQMLRFQRGATTGGHMFSFVQDYVANGGKTGYVSMTSLEDRMKEMQRMWSIASMHGMHPASIAHAFLDIVADANTAIENGIRIAAYRASIEAGESTAEAVSEAKNLTVNFNRRGEWTPHLNAAFLFFNPNVQGTARIIKAMKKSPKMMAGIVSSQIAVGILAAMLSSLDEDDDGVAYWDKPDVQQLKSKNLILIIPGTKGKRLTLPLPYGYNAFFSLGYALVDMARGKMSKANVVGSLLDAVMTGFSPVGAGNINSVIDVLPTVVQPFVQAAANRNAFGNPIFPDHGQAAVPNSEKMWDSTRGNMSEAITTYLNAVTGGDAHISGWASVSPEVLNHYVRFVTGGLGVAALDTFNAITQVATLGYDDADLSRLPFRREVFGQHKPEKDSALYYERLNDLKAVVASYKAAVKNGDAAKAQALREKYGDQMIDDVGGAISAATKALKEVRDAERAIRDSDLPRGAKELQMREQKRRRGEIFTEWNRMFTEANQGRLTLP